jgi:L1 cell adhesion molecule like protein
MEFAVGIDLGTTYSCVAVWKDGSVEILPNDQGNRVTPSYVAFNEDERLIGDAAKNQAIRNAPNTVYDAKRLIGRLFDDPLVQSDIMHWPFQVVEGRDNKPMIMVRYRGEEKIFAAEEISSMVLGKMKQSAEEYLGMPVTAAVVTVPAYFNDSQRQATKDAGTIAGLEVRRILNEPTAAAIAYGLDKDRSVEKTILVFDLGGGTFDVSLVMIHEDLFEVKATSGDTHLGGEDFDIRMVEYCLQDFKRRHNVDLSGNAKAKRRLKTACERAKRSLASCVNTTVDIECLEGVDYFMNFSRAKFEELNLDYFQKCIDIVQTLLEDCRITPTEVSEVVLVGGSTRIVKIQMMMQELFRGKDICRSINPDEAIAQGAAVQGAILSGEQHANVNSILLVDVTPLGLGVKIKGDIMSTIIPRNTLIPTCKTHNYTSSVDYQTTISVKVYEGERAMVSGNHLLGEFRLTGIEPALQGVPSIDVTMEVDANGILLVTALDTQTGRSTNIVIANGRGRLTTEEINAMIAHAERFRRDDLQLKRNSEARNDLEKSISRLRSFLPSLMPSSDTELLELKLTEAEQWSQLWTNAEAEELQAKRQDFEGQVLTMITRCNSRTAFIGFN